MEIRKMKKEKLEKLWKEGRAEVVCEMKNYVEIRWINSKKHEMIEVLK